MATMPRITGFLPILELIWFITPHAIMAVGQLA